MLASVEVPSTRANLSLAGPLELVSTTRPTKGTMEGSTHAVRGGTGSHVGPTCSSLMFNSYRRMKTEKVLSKPGASPLSHSVLF